MPQSLKQLIGSLRLPPGTSSNSGDAWIGLREYDETTHIRSARDGKPDRNGDYRTHGVMVEVFQGGQFGYAATPSLEVSALQRAVELASEQAAQASRWSVHRFDAGAARPASHGRYQSPRRVELRAHSPAELVHLAVRTTERMKISPQIVRAEAATRAVDCTVRYASTSGADFEQSFLLTSVDCTAIAQDGSLTQRRTLSENLQAGLELTEEASLGARSVRIAEEAIELLSAEDCPTETTSLVLLPSQMTLQIHESIGHPLELDRILGDERNYAGWSFVRPENFGNLQYGSSLMNVTFDPTVAGEFASYAFDDGGAPAERQFLIREGVLERGLGGRESQLRLGASVPGVSNFRASGWNRPPVDRMANINLEPGASSYEDIIGGIRRGVLMDTNRSWSIDDYRNKFQFGCEYAKLIEDGKITRTLRNPNYRGITLPFWRSLRKVGNLATAETHGTPNCGKAEPNQVIRVGHRSVTCLFEDIEVFGGGA